MIGSYGPIIEIVTLDKFDPSPISLISVRLCMACGALIPDSSTWQHEQWHEQNDIEVDAGEVRGSSD